MVAASVLGWRAAPVLVVLRILDACLSGLMPVAIAWLTKSVLDRLTAAGPIELAPLLVLALLLAIAGVVGVLLPNVSRYIDGELERAIARTVQPRMYQAVNGFAGLARFEDPHFHDRLRLAQRAGRSGPSQLLQSGVGAIQHLLTLAGFIGILLVLAPWMAGIALLAALPTLKVELGLSRRRAQMMWRMSHAERRESFYSNLLSSVDAAKEVRLFGLGGFFATRMMKELLDLHTAQRKMDRRELFAQALLGLLSAVVAGIGLVWVILQARAGNLGVGDVTVFVAAVAGVQGGSSALVQVASSTHHAMLLFDHYLAIVTVGSDLPEPAHPLPAPRLRTGIELRDVWFRYSDQHPWVLKGVSLGIPAGQALALVGLNGAGKSTLVKLLCRFYDPTRGQVLWNGVDIRTMSVELLRERIGAVFQDFMSYDLTVAENIGLGDLQVMDDRERVEAAARRAGVDEHVDRLPKQYDTLLTRMFFDNADKEDPETGVVLSGGQWQRLALARALLRDRRDLLILDEPSAGLDAEAEFEVHSQLRKHRSGRTSLLISHRLSTVRDADVIAVLADGVVTELGTHAELMAAGDGYARLFTLQARGYQSPDLASPTDSPDDLGTSGTIETPAVVSAADIAH